MCRCILDVGWLKALRMWSCSTLVSPPGRWTAGRVNYGKTAPSACPGSTARPTTRSCSASSPPGCSERCVYTRVTVLSGEFVHHPCVPTLCALWPFVRVSVCSAVRRSPTHPGSFPRVAGWTGAGLMPTEALARSDHIHHTRHAARPIPVCRERRLLQQPGRGVCVSVWKDGLK